MNRIDSAPRPHRAGDPARTRHPAAASAIALACLLVLAPLAAAQKAAGPAKKLYCWNENGRKVCGDALPASAVDAARTEISARSGMATSRVDRALTGDERAAAALAAEAERDAAVAAEALKRRELAMVDSYASEEELRRAYQHRITLSEGAVKASRLSLVSLRLSLVNLLSRAGEAELASKPIAKTLADNIQRQHGELLRLQGLLVQQVQDRNAIEGEFADSLTRYRALKVPAGNG